MTFKDKTINVSMLNIMLIFYVPPTTEVAHNAIASMINKWTWWNVKHIMSTSVQQWQLVVLCTAAENAPTFYK